MKKTLIITLFGALSTMSLSAKIGYVNSPELFQRYSQTKIVRDNLLKERKSLEDKLKKQKIELDKMEIELRGKGTKATAADKKAFETKAINFQKAVEESQRKLTIEENKKMQEVNNLISVAIKNVAKKEKFDYVFEEAAMKFGGEDLTSKVLEVMEKSKKIN